MPFIAVTEAAFAKLVNEQYAVLRRALAAQDRVLLVDQLGERRLGDRDERHLVGHLEHRELALGRHLEQRLGHGGVLEARPEPESREVVVG